MSRLLVTVTVDARPVTVQVDYTPARLRVAAYRAAVVEDPAEVDVRGGTVDGRQLGGFAMAHWLERHRVGEDVLVTLAADADREAAEDVRRARAEDRNDDVWMVRNAARGAAQRTRPAR